MKEIEEKKKVETLITRCGVSIAPDFPTGILTIGGKKRSHFVGEPAGICQSQKVIFSDARANPKGKWGTAQ